LEECLEELDEKSRDLCSMRYGRDLKPAGIASLLGVEPNTVAKALQRVRDRLRDCVSGKAANGVPA
jgi:RNA polymerase sigma-70 factor (ECF subfamily)